MSEIGAPLSEWWHFASYVHTRQGLMSDVVGMDRVYAQELFDDSRRHPLPQVPNETELHAYELGVHPRYLTRLADALRVPTADVISLGEDKSFWQQPLSPEAVAQEYRVNERLRREEVRIAHDRARFAAAADELLGGAPDLTEQRFRSFVHWSQEAQHLGLDVFTDQRLRELVSHWRGKTNGGTDQVPADFDPREKGKFQADLFLKRDLARRSGALPTELAEELALYEQFVQFQLTQLNARYPGGVFEDDGPPVTLSTDIFAALSGAGD